MHVFDSKTGTQIPVSATCGSCRFAGKPEIKQDLKSRMNCFRYPPQAFLLVTAQGIVPATASPIVEPHMTCGEFQWKLNPEIAQ